MGEGEEIARAETTIDDMICEHMSPEMSARLKIVQKLLAVGTLSSPFWLNLVVKTDVKTLTSS